jgi:hypothetical protein
MGNLKRSPLRLLPLLVLLAVALFPLGWLGQVWVPLGALIDWLFATTLAHAIGHAAIFFLLGCSLLASFPQLCTHPRLYAGLMLLASIGQEAFQLLSKQRTVLLFDDVRDVVIDCVAFALPFVLVWLWRRRG